MTSILPLIEGYYFLDTYQERLAKVKAGVARMIAEHSIGTAKNWAEWVEFAVTARQQRPIIMPRIEPGGVEWLDNLITTLDAFLILSSDDEASKAVYGWLANNDRTQFTFTYIIPKDILNAMLSARPFNLVGSGWKMGSENVDGINVTPIEGTGTLFYTAIDQVKSLLSTAPAPNEYVPPDTETPNPYQTSGGDRIISPYEQPPPSGTGGTLAALGFGATALLGFIGFMLLRGRK